MSNSLPLNKVGVAGENLGVTCDPTVGLSHPQIQHAADPKRLRICGCECENSVLAPAVESPDAEAPDAEAADKEAWPRP